MIFINDEILFIHIPKTGGKSIYAHLLDNYNQDTNKINVLKDNIGHWNYQHASIKDVMKYDLIDINNVLKFVVVRNPWDWHVSWYHWMRLGSQKNHYYPEIFNLSFSEYIFELYDFYLKMGNNDLSWKNSNHCNLDQTFWIRDENDKFVVDNILRFENLGNDWRVFSEKNNFKVKDISYKMNDYRRKHNNDRHFQYNDETKEIIGIINKPTIELFDYIF